VTPRNLRLRAIFLSTLKQSLSVFHLSTGVMTDLKRKSMRPGSDGQTLERIVNVRVSTITADYAGSAFGGTIYV